MRSLESRDRRNARRDSASAATAEERTIRLRAVFVMTAALRAVTTGRTWQRDGTWKSTTTLLSLMYARFGRFRLVVSDAYHWSLMLRVCVCVCVSVLACVVVRGGCVEGCHWPAPQQALGLLLAYVAANGTHCFPFLSALRFLFVH